jgi:glycosyltransferase involved in cell wall biosynthesis
MPHRIAQVVATFSPTIGGMGAVALDECNSLVDRGFEPTVFTLAYGTAEEQHTRERFKVERLVAWPKLGDAGLTPELVWRLRQFDLIHLHYPWYGGAEWVWLQKKLGGAPYVVTYHMDARPTGSLKRAVQTVYDPIIGALVLRGARKVFTVDPEHFTRSRLGHTIAPQKIVPLPNPVDTDIFKPQVVTPASCGLGGLEQQRILLFVGNLLKTKRLDLVVRALPGLPNDVVLVVVGSGYAESEYRTLVERMGLSGRVRFVGSRPRAQLAKLYCLAACTVVASDTESFSLVALEALLAGCPTVVSDLPGLASRLFGAGTSFTPGSLPSLEAALKRVLAWNSLERVERLANAQRRAREEYSLTAHTKKLCTVYEEILN